MDVGADRLQRRPGPSGGGQTVEGGGGKYRV